MKIGIIETGHIGSNAARLFVKAVVLSNLRGPETLDDLAEIDRKLTEDLAIDACA